MKANDGQVVSVQEWLIFRIRPFAYRVGFYNSPYSQTFLRGFWGSATEAHQACSQVLPCVEVKVINLV
jgi:hypothetical protein